MLWSSIGLPATQRNCFSSGDSVLVPLPAATMITPTSRDPLPASRIPLPGSPIEQMPEHIRDRPHADDFDPARALLRNSALRHVSSGHSHLRRFAEAPLRLRHWPDLAAESHLAEEDRRARHGAIVDTRCQRACYREIPRGLLHSHPAHDVEKYIELRKGETSPLVQHGEKERQTAAVETRAHSLRSSIAGFGCESLDLDQYRAGALHQSGDCATGCTRQTIAEEKLGWILHGDEPFLGHSENADLVDTAEPVLGRAQHSMLEHALALEVQHGIDDVLEGFRSSDAATLGDVSDCKDCRLGLLSEAHETRGAFAHLSDVSRRTFQIRCENRLDRVDDDRVELLGARGGDDRFQQSLVEQGDVFSRCVQPFGAELHLERGFLARHIERRVPEVLEPARDLKQECRLANARLAADEDHRSRNNAAAQYEVEFVDACFDSAAGGALNIAEPLCYRDASTFGHGLGALYSSARSGRRRARRRHLFHQSVPVPAHVTAPGPLWMVSAAAGTAVDSLCFRTHFSRRGDRFSKRV